MTDRVVLVAEPEPVTLDRLVGLLRQWAYTPVAVRSAQEALDAVASTRFLFSVIAFELARANGMDLLHELRAQPGNPGPIIVLFDRAQARQIPAAAALGVDDVVPKPIKREELENAIKELQSRASRPKRPPAADDVEERLEREVALWCSAKMREVWRIVQQAASVDITVLVAGETGTGKDLVARAIHRLSSRRGGPFVKVNCAAVPRELLESELFGHERGAFTGAHQLKVGKFEAANHGAIFLDEIGDLHPALQAKLLHILQDGECSRVGGKSTIKVDVRVIAATNRDLEGAVAAGQFREDLYYRLNVIGITVPPLRERLEEIPALVNYFVDRYSWLFNRQGFAVSPPVMDRLMRHTYPGNVRELENIVKRMIVLNDPLLTTTRLREAIGDNTTSAEAAPPEALSLRDIARRAAVTAEREAITRTLERTRWNRVKAAKILHVSYRALLYKIREGGLQQDDRPTVKLDNKDHHLRT